MIHEKVSYKNYLLQGQNGTEYDQSHYSYFVVQFANHIVSGSILFGKDFVNHIAFDCAEQRHF